MTVHGIPIKHYGLVIGSATINDNGFVNVVFGPGVQILGMELISAIEEGLVQGLRISPICTPAIPADDSNEGVNDAPYLRRINNVKHIRY